MALQSSFSSSSSSSSSNGFSYVVFLSFRGTDTRHGFTGYLYKALCDKGIHTFIDDEELQRGEEITPSLIKAIHESRIAIPVFSTNYAASSFCLDELVNIMECSKANGRLVLPVLYNVDPSDVRHQKGSYEEAMAKHEERFKDDMQKVQKWRMALRQVANLSGFHFTHGDGYEHKFIEKIVKDVSREIKHVVLPVAKYLVGLESRVSKVISLLDVGSNDDGVHIIGIHGIGGIGKTTLAWAVYNRIANHFEGTCFLEDVRENSDKYGLVHLHCTFLSELLGEKEIKLLGVQQGISIIQHRLQKKKVLLILDDVDKWKQLQTIVGELNWFGPSSKIIITTRDKHLLACHGIERTYELEGLDKAQALELLSWKAFKIINVNPIYKDVLNNAVTYACGLPLALEVIGSNLFGKSIKQWESALDRYEKIPSNEIHDILKVSFNALGKDEQSVFLDIACCFGSYYKLQKVEDILHAHYGVCMNYHLEVLVEKSLINVSSYGAMRLHNLIRDMGREIVRQESLNKPGNRSRLWFPEDIVQVLEDSQGTAEIEIIHLAIPHHEKVREIKWDGKAFKRMKNLKTLVIRHCHFSEGPKHLPRSLRILEWWEYPSQSLPCDFHPRKLSMLKLPRNRLTSVELAVLFKKFVNLKVLDLGHSECLIEIPDVSGLPNLEELLFYWCRNLTTIHSSVGFLDKLRILMVQSCVKLRTFPPIINLTSLEQLGLCYCNSLENFPQVTGKMENITEISLYGTRIKELPFSFRNLTRLRQLSVLHSRRSFRMRSSLVMMPELVEIRAEELDGWHWLSPKQEEGEETVSSTVSSNVEHLSFTSCKLSDDFLQIVPAWFANVKQLCLNDNNFRVISACIKEYRFLRKLTVDDCQHLREIRGVPPNLEQFSARNCKSLTSSCTSMLLNQELHEAGNTSFIVPVERIPEWFEHRSGGPSISFWFRNKFPAIAISIVGGIIPYSDVPIPTVGILPSVIINGKNHHARFEERLCYWSTPTIDHMFLFDLQKIKFNNNLDEALLENEWNHVEVSYEISFSNCIEQLDMLPPLKFTKECGVHVFKQKSNMEDIQFTAPYKRRKLDDGDRGTRYGKVYERRKK